MKVNLPSNGLSRIMLSTIHIQILSCVLLILIMIHCIVYMHSRQQTATRLNIHNFFFMPEKWNEEFWLLFMFLAYIYSNNTHILYILDFIYIRWYSIHSVREKKYSDRFFFCYWWCFVNYDYEQSFIVLWTPQIELRNMNFYDRFEFFIHINFLLFWWSTPFE